MTPHYFAYKQKLDWLVYKDLASREKKPELKEVLEKLIDHELEDYKFWRQFIDKEIQIPKWKIYVFRFLRAILGLTFTAKFLEGREEGMIKKYESYLETVEDAKQREEIREIIRHERFHEASFLELIKEEKVEFVSSIVLGMNDGLIELTGALAGFSLALSKPAIVAMAGLITGISAALSMAASAYMATKHEVGSKKPPAKVATYTGISYIIVVAILVTPYFIFSNVFISLTVMLGLVILIIAGMTLYTSVLFRRKFHHQFGQMLLFSLGVAPISFTIAYLFQRFSGIGV